ncbi:MAG: SDR family oxidoreductase [Cupriavidus sp.]|nr:SDR family oxidoreductase [Cupriavidus sp.]MCA3704368.1 SDR family oxidoreductase [Methylobacterium sp.]
MAGRLAGKTALLTAAGQGIGRATAIAFAREGANVIATDRDHASLSQLKNIDPRISTFLLDVTDVGGISTFIDKFKKIDVLFNCAGIVSEGSIIECEENEWRRAFEINVSSVYNLCRPIVPMMVSRGGGSIINVASVVSSLKGTQGRFAYGTTKAAVIGLTKSIANDFVRFGVRCNAICPGTIETPSLQVRIANRALTSGSFEAAKQEFISRQPMGRLGYPEEIAAFAVYLASDESAFTTGQCHIIDGGWLG